MRTKPYIYGTAALFIALAATLLFSCNLGKPTAYPLSITFVEWTDTFALPAEAARQAERIGLRLPVTKGDWATLAITNNGSELLRFESGAVEYELHGQWQEVAATGWPGLHGQVWWPGTGTRISVPRPPNVPKTARWRFRFVCSLDPVSGPRRRLTQTYKKLLRKETLMFYTPKMMLSPVIPPREASPQQSANGVQPSGNETNRAPVPAGSGR